MRREGAAAGERWGWGKDENGGVGFISFYFPWCKSRTGWNRRVARFIEESVFDPKEHGERTRTDLWGVVGLREGEKSREHLARDTLVV